MGGRTSSSIIQDISDSDSENGNMTYLQKRKLKKMRRAKENPTEAQPVESAVTLRPFRDLMNAVPSESGFRQRYKGEDMGPERFGYYEGKGTYHLANGHTYEGNVMHGKKHGFGILKYSYGAIYEGEYEHGKRCGKGKFTFENGNIYDGEWKDGKMNGKGIYLYTCGDKYEGEFLNDKFHGHGVYTYLNGDTYDGEFVEDVRHGKGKLVMLYRGVYEGDFFQNRITGRGVYRYADASTDGSSEKLVANNCNDVVANDGLQHGGHYRSYQGEWVDFKKHGKGELVFANGDVYTGDFKKDQRYGFGLIIFSYGKRYAGEWKKDYPHGQGRVTYPNGEVYEGLWKRGIQVEFLEVTNGDSNPHVDAETID